MCALPFSQQIKHPFLLYSPATPPNSIDKGSAMKWWCGWRKSSDTTLWLCHGHGGCMWGLQNGFTGGVLSWIMIFLHQNNQFVKSNFAIDEKSGINLICLRVISWRWCFCYRLLRRWWWCSWFCWWRGK